MSNVAADVRERKEKYPSEYCASPRCLWRIKSVRGDTPCPRHPVKLTPTVTPAPEPVNLDEYVKASLDGATGDDRYLSQDDACDKIGAALARRAGRSLTQGESVKVGYTVALEWNRREQEALSRPASPFYVGETYHASAINAATERKRELERAIRYGARLAGVIARMAEDAPAMDLAAD